MLIREVVLHFCAGRSVTPPIVAMSFGASTGFVGCAWKPDADARERASACA